MTFQFGVKTFARDQYREVVTRMWVEEKKTQRQIAAHIGKSKNAVAGMIAYFNLPKKTEGRGVPRGWTAKRINDAKPKVDPAPAPVGPIGTFPDGDSCRFIAGDPSGDFQCCGHPGFPWCDYHKKRCTTERKTAVTL